MYKKRNTTPAWKQLIRKMNYIPAKNLNINALTNDAIDGLHALGDLTVDEGVKNSHDMVEKLGFVLDACDSSTGFLERSPCCLTPTLGEVKPLGQSL